MAKLSEKVQEAIFTQLLNIPANSECADCRTASPTWVSLDFGVFLCMRCSGVHRQIGPHITRVRSVRLDGWTKENIEIMATVGNKIANDFYEHTMQNYSRKPGTNSSPEECRRFVDDKYINKKFVIEGYQEPVKELLACRANGTKPDYSYSTQAPPQQQQQPQKQQFQQPQKQEAHPRNHSLESPHANITSLRKKSLSLDKFPRDVVNQKAHQNHDLLSGDDDLLGGDAPSNNQGNQSNTHPHPHGHVHAHSASPAKINFAKFKKGNSQPPSQENQPTSQWTTDLVGSLNQNNNNNNSNNYNQDSGTGTSNILNLYNQNTQQQQQQPQQPIDLKQLYSQGGHQNHFMQGQSRQNWGHQGMNPVGYQGGYNAGYNMGQNHGQYNQAYGQPGYNQPMNGYQQPVNFNGGMGAGPQMGYNQGFVQNQNQVQYPNNGFLPVQNANKFF